MLKADEQSSQAKGFGLGFGAFGFRVYRVASTCRSVGVGNPCKASERGGIGRVIRLALCMRNIS